MTMDFKTYRVMDSSGLVDLIGLVKANTYNELDCEKETYINYIFRVVFLGPAHEVFLLYGDNEPIGYVIVMINKLLWHDMTITDIFLKHEFQGNALIVKLLEPVVELALKNGSKRVRWHSHIFQDGRIWNRCLKKMGATVNEYKSFYVNMDGSVRKAFNDNKNRG